MIGIINLRKIFNNFFFNLSLFLLLIIGIQNSAKKTKVNFLIGETIHLPVSFIIGVSFISGSITSNLLTVNLEKENN